MVRQRDVAFFSAATFVGLGLTFAAGVVAARWLGPATYGELSLVRSFAALLAIVAPLGLDLALLRHLGENEHDWPRSLAQVRRFRAICAVVNLAVLAVAALWVGPWVGANVYRQPGFAALLSLALLALPVAGDAAILSATLRVLGAVSLQNVGVLVLQPLVRTGALLLLLAAGLGPYGVVVATALGAATASAFMAIALSSFLRRRGMASAAAFEAPDRGAMARVFRYSIWLAGLLLLNNGLRVVDLLVLGRFRPSDEVGRYAALSTIAAIIIILPQALSQTLAPQVARLHAAGDIAGVRAALGDYLRRAVLAASPLFAGVAVFGPWLDLVFGARYRFGAGLSLILACTCLAAGCLGQMGVSLTMTGRHRQEFAILLAAFALSIALCWWLAPGFGGVGVGVGVLIGTLTLNGARTALSAHVLGGLGVRWWDAALPPLVCLAIALALRTVLDHGFAHAWPTAIGGACVLAVGFAAVYGVVLLTPGERRSLLGASWRR